MWVFQDCEKEEDDKVKDPTSDVKTPSTNTRAGCLIKYNVSTTFILGKGKLLKCSVPLFYA